MKGDTTVLSRDFPAFDTESMVSDIRADVLKSLHQALFAKDGPCRSRIPVGEPDGENVGDVE